MNNYIRQHIFAGIITFLCISTKISTNDSGMIAEPKKISMFKYVIPYLVDPVNLEALETRIDSEEILMGVIFTRYYQFWTMLSLYTCTIYYSKESPYPFRSDLRNSCMKWANLLFDHLSESKGEYFRYNMKVIRIKNISYNQLKNWNIDLLREEALERSTVLFITSSKTDRTSSKDSVTRSLRRISSRQQLLEAYARKMHEIFNNSPSDTWFDSMSKITKNLDSKYGKTIRICRNSLSAEEIASEYYAEVWRRVIIFYGDNLVRLESYYNSVLVDDKDVSVRDLIPSFRACIAFWRNVPSIFTTEDIPDEPAERTQMVLEIVRIHEKYKMLLRHIDTSSEVIGEARYYLGTQPSGVSEYVYLLHETTDNRDQPNSSESLHGPPTPSTVDVDEDVITEHFEE